MSARWIEVTTIGDLVDRAADRTDRRCASSSPRSGSAIRSSPRGAPASPAVCTGLACAAGDKVGILMHNCLDFVVALVGASKLGAVVVPVNGRFKAHELGHVISHADIRVLLTAAGPAGAPDYPALLNEVFPGLATQNPADLQLPEAPMLRNIVLLASERRHARSPVPRSSSTRLAGRSRTGRSTRSRSASGFATLRC